MAKRRRSHNSLFFHPLLPGSVKTISGQASRKHDACRITDVNVRRRNKARMMTE
jgi:hypothetical protein